MNVLSLCGPESGLPKNPSVSGVGGLFWFLNSSSENAITFSGIGKVMKSGFWQTGFGSTLHKSNWRIKKRWNHK